MPDPKLKKPSLPPRSLFAPLDKKNPPHVVQAIAKSALAAAEKAAKPLGEKKARKKSNG